MRTKKNTLISKVATNHHTLLIYDHGFKVKQWQPDGSYKLFDGDTFNFGSYALRPEVLKRVEKVRALQNIKKNPPWYSFFYDNSRENLHAAEDNLKRLLNESSYLKNIAHC